MDERLKKGRAVREGVMGRDYVARQMEDDGGYLADYQAFVTRQLWGDVWGREGLPLKVRSLLAMTVLTAQGKTADVKLHVEGALTNGCTPREIYETLLQSAVYCGFPVAMASVRAADEVFKAKGIGKRD